MKKVVILVVITIVVDLSFIVGGIIGDIIYWRWVYENSTGVGHGVPAISILGFLAAVLFSLIMLPIIVIIQLKESKRKC